MNGLDDQTPMPSKEEILEAIREGVYDAFYFVGRDIQKAIDAAIPYPSQILDAIADGTKEAMAAQVKGTRRAGRVTP